jgi:hypothetical protein
VFGYGRWWTVFSAGWLHGSLLHIVFNMMWIRDLGPVVADVFGAGRMVIIYTVAGVTGFLMSSSAVFLPPLPLLRGAQLTLGASAPIFGLLGARLLRPPDRQFLVRGQAVRYAVILGIFWPDCRASTTRYGGGFLGGYYRARARSAPTRAHRSHRDRGPLPPRSGALHRRIDLDGAEVFSWIEKEQRALCSLLFLRRPYFGGTTGTYIGNTYA